MLVLEMYDLECNVPNLRIVDVIWGLRRDHHPDHDVVTVEIRTKKDEKTQ